MFPTPPYPTNKRQLVRDDENEAKKWKIETEGTSSYMTNEQIWNPMWMTNQWAQSGVNPQTAYWSQNQRFTPPLDLQNTQNFYDLTAHTQTPMTFAVNPAFTSSTLLTPESDADDSREPPEWVIEGRLPIVNRPSKYIMDVDQVRRRCGAPEFMNMSTLIKFFRKCKNKELVVKVKSYMAKNDIKVAAMQRQKVNSKFTMITEQESVTLAQDIGQLLKRFFPKETLGKKTLERLLEQGKSPEQCRQSLSNSILCIQQVLKTLSSRQPAISGKVEQIKRNFEDADKDRDCQELNEKYEKFSRLTHGFGHADSLNYYKKFQEVFEEALVCCQAICQGQHVELSRRTGEPMEWKYEMKKQE